MKNGVSLLYAVDAKKRSGMSDSFLAALVLVHRVGLWRAGRLRWRLFCLSERGLLPNWIQSSAGLEYSSKIGDLKAP